VTAMALEARQVAAGACALVADGDEESAKQLLNMFLREQLDNEEAIITVMNALIGAFMGVAVTVAGCDASRFHALGARLATSGGEW